MSRIGRMPIAVPKGVEVKLDGSTVAVKGPKGALTKVMHPEMTIQMKDGVITISRPSDEKSHKALHGLTRTLVSNMVVGVSTGFQRTLEIVGVGYRAQKQGEKLVLNVGMSVPVEVPQPKGITFNVEGNNRVHVVGPDKELVGLWAAKLRMIRPPDPYKGKGIRYAKEVVRLKPGKSGKKGAGAA